MRRLKGLLVNDTSLADHHGSALVSARARELAGEAGMDLRCGWNWSAIETTLAGQHGFDLVVVNGEGSLHDSSPTARRIAALGRIPPLLQVLNGR